MVEELDERQLKVLRNAFDAIDRDKSGSIKCDMVGDILETLGHKLDKKELEKVIKEVDADASGYLDFDEFCVLASKFMEVEEDVAAIREELREVFRLYDKDHKGYLTNQMLRDILRELDDKLSAKDLDMMIDEIDADGSGTVDFEGRIFKNLWKIFFDQLDKEQLKVLRRAFDAFDPDKQGDIDSDDVSTILEMLGAKVDDKTLKKNIKEFDRDGKGRLDFNKFSNLAVRFVEIEVEEDFEAVAKELKEAFRLYDKEGRGYLTVAAFRDILHELDDKLSPEDLDMMIDEIDADGSGTVDFQEFMDVMRG